MPAQVIKISGARQHNLKNLHVELPREKLVVITGLSGSGKSSLAFDTLYAEGQRRYVESLSAYARQFLDLALHSWKAPTESLNCGDVDGNITLQSSALTPNRRGWDGRLPVPGQMDHPRAAIGPGPSPG